MKPKINKENIARIKNKPGIYRIYSCDNKLQYVGTSKILKHRLQSYYQKDDFSVNKTKKALRKKACKFSYHYMPITKARIAEKRIKKNLPHNHL